MRVHPRWRLAARVSNQPASRPVDAIPARPWPSTKEPPAPKPEPEPPPLPPPPPPPRPPKQYRPEQRFPGLRPIPATPIPEPRFPGAGDRFPGERPPEQIPYCYKAMDPTPTHMLRLDLSNVGGRKGTRERMAGAFHLAFRYVYEAWSALRWIRKLPRKNQREAAWSMAVHVAGQEVTSATPAEYFGNGWGEYSDKRLDEVYAGYTAIGEVLSDDENPLTVIAAYPDCEKPSVFIDAGSHATALCKGFFRVRNRSRSVESQADEIIWAIANALELNDARQYAEYANRRSAVAGRCLVPQIAYFPCDPTPGLSIWYQPSGTGRDKCTSSEKKAVTDAFNVGFLAVDAAYRFLEVLATLPKAQRATMWDYGGLAAGGIQADQAYAELGSYFHFWSASTWFGPYTDERFETVRDRVERLWLRYQYGTERHDKVQIVCRSHKRCWFVAGGWHNPLSVGRIYLCKPFFTASSSDQPHLLMHEMMHFLVDDSFVKNSPHDVKSSTYCDKGKIRDICYDADMALRLVEGNKSLTLQNIDNYVSWIWYFYLRFRGCWPHKWIAHGTYSQTPEVWVPPPPKGFGYPPSA